jgi:hypothetical protein
MHATIPVVLKCVRADVEHEPLLLKAQADACDGGRQATCDDQDANLERVTGSCPGQQEQTTGSKAE